MRVPTHRPIRCRWPFLALTGLAALLPHAARGSSDDFDAPTAAECRAKVNARYEESHAQSNPGSPGMSPRYRYLYLRQCDRKEKRDQSEAMYKAHRRLTGAIENLRQGGSISAAERDVLTADHDRVSTFPASGDRETCLRLYADYLRYESLASHRPRGTATRVYRCAGAGGTEFSEVPCRHDGARTETTMEIRTEPQPSARSCDEVKSRIASAKKEHDDAVTALLPQKNGETAAGGSSDWRALDRRRLDALSELRWQRDLAQAMGCSER